jgi:glycosyltransferase involved in cell wall biosynthesis
MTLVSVVIPVHDGARHLAEAIESALAQEGPAVEVVVVDDGSTDASASMARSYAPDVRLLEREHAGPAAARNAGIAAARGTHIAFLDADDLMPRWAIAARLEEGGSVRAPADLVWGRVRCFVSPELGPAEAARLACPPGPVPGRIGGGLLIRRAACTALGPMPTHLRVGEFIAWAARAPELDLREREVEDVVLHRRLHRGNMGRGRPEARGDYARLLKEMLDRRRGASEASA